MYMLLQNNKLSQALINGTTKIAVTAALLMTVGIASSFATPITTVKAANSNTISPVPTAVNTAVPASTAVAAPATNGSDVVMASFHKEFRTADVMQVETRKDYTKLTFRLNGVIMFAYYTPKGDRMAVVRNIVSTELPIRLLMDLKQNHSDSWITDLFEMDSNDQTVYYVTLENSDTKLTLRSDDGITWQTYQKENKANNQL